MLSYSLKQHVNFTNVVPDQPVSIDSPQITVLGSTSVSFQAETGSLSGNPIFMT